MAVCMKFLRFICVTGIGVAVVASASAVYGDQRTQRAEELANLVEDLRSAMGANRKAAGVFASHFAKDQSHNVAETPLKATGSEPALGLQILGQATREATGTASPAQYDTQGGFTEKEVPAHSANTGVIPPHVFTPPSESPAPRIVPSDDLNVQRPPKGAHPHAATWSRLPSVFNPSESSRSTAASTSTGRNYERTSTSHTRSPTIATATTPDAVYSSSPRTAQGRGRPTDADASRLPSRFSDVAFVHYRLESLHKIRENLERLAAVVKLLAHEIADEQLAYVQACEAGKCHVFD